MLRKRGEFTSVAIAIAFMACASSRRQGAAPGPEVAPDSLGAAGARERAESVFQSFLGQYEGADYGRLAAELGVRAAPAAKLSFDPTQALYYDRILRDLKLTPEEHALYAKQGIVSVDQGQRYSMGSAYFSIYSRDLPVLVTTDSILHALHRSYDTALKNLERSLFIGTLRNALGSAHEELGRTAASLPSTVQPSASDVDLYLTMARSLLGEPVRSKLGSDAKVSELLENVARLTLQDPNHPTTIYGGTRPIDYSQYKVRGHYTESPDLSAYFRAMMWLGRADSGFVLQQPDPQAKIRVDSLREARSAALLTLVLEKSGAAAGLGRMRAIVDFMVGRSDDVSTEQLGAWLAKNGVRDGAALADDALVRRMGAQLSLESPQQIRSQVLSSSVGEHPVSPPDIMQVFGQRFVLDSFVLAHVVFDSIVFEREKQLRMMPTGLDVMAALGNDEAVRLLRPELERFHYAPNLLAARKTVEHAPASTFGADLYHAWLGALRTLHAEPTSGAFPEIMRQTPWQRKQLQTQLASWAELRHDTLLYAKQSYTAYPECGYPAGFVEPYPAFFDALERLATRASGLLAAADVSGPKGTGGAAVRDSEVKFFASFAEVMGKLSSLAKKELAAEPFTDDEAFFLKRTIDWRAVGSGTPKYNGWYPQLVYGGEPAGWLPTVADVHTDPMSSTVLEEGVGDAEFIVVAIDNGADHTAYVGPIYSYYEFTQPAADRMTDEAWRARVATGPLPRRPAFSEVFRAPRLVRELGPRH